MTFYTTGERLTNILRDLYNSHKIYNLAEIVKDSTGLSLKESLELGIEIGQGKTKIIGDSRDETMESVKDGTYKTDITVIDIKKSLDDRFVYTNSKINALSINIKFSVIPDIYSFRYNKGIRDGDGTSQHDQDKLLRSNLREQLSKIIRNMDYLYMHLGFNISDIAFLTKSTICSETEIRLWDERWTAYKIQERQANLDAIGIAYEREKKKELVLEILPTKLTNQNNGWISPEGKFYECNPLEHRQLGENLRILNIVPQKEITATYWMENNGWLKLQDYGFVRSPQLIEIENILTRGLYLNETQINLIVDYWLDNSEYCKTFNYRAYDKISDFYKMLEERYNIVI